jgi:hypothetical protein
MRRDGGMILRSEKWDGDGSQFVVTEFAWACMGSKAAEMTETESVVQYFMYRHEKINNKTLFSYLFQISLGLNLLRQTIF